MDADHLEELVFTQSDDGVELDGAVFRPTGGETKPLAVVWVHGLTGHFNERYIVAIGRDLARRGFTVVTGNNRGHHVGVGIGSKDGQRVLGGGWWELCEESSRDIAAWIAFAVRLGFGSVVLVGHSLGGLKVLVYQAERQDPRVRGLVAASPAVHLRQRMLGAPAEIRALAERLVAEGRGQELLPWGQLPGGFNASAGTFLSWLRPELDVAGLDTPNPAVARIRCPLLAIAGTEREALSAADLETIRAGATAAPRVDTRVFQDADHGYDGHELEVAEFLAGWIDAL